jgi:hypothetical protein
MNPICRPLYALPEDDRDWDSCSRHGMGFLLLVFEAAWLAVLRPLIGAALASPSSLGLDFANPSRTPLLVPLYL